MKFENRIKKIREIKGWSQAELAEKSGISPSAISQYESGGREPGLKSLINISNAFGLTIDDLINEDIKIPRNFEFEAFICEKQSGFYSPDDYKLDEVFGCHISSLYSCNIGNNCSKWKFTMTELLYESK